MGFVSTVLVIHILVCWRFVLMFWGFYNSASPSPRMYVFFQRLRNLEVVSNKIPKGLVKSYDLLRV